MEDPTTIAMNLTFFGTLAIGLVLFLGVFLALVITLLLAGVGRLLATAATALFRGRTSDRGTSRQEAAQPAKSAKAGPAQPAKPGRKEPQLSPEWAAAVARADERASARAKADAAPEVRVSVRELPSPKAPVRELKEVGPLVESATDRNGSLASAPRAFVKPPLPTQSPILDTGSLTMRKHQPAPPAQRQDQRPGQRQDQRPGQRQDQRQDQHRKAS
ncbi:MAG: hypothetical protein NTU93_08130 [Arthrobacter sp.]|nr:hypothetical protein [Arthrobacter sp.]